MFPASDGVLSRRPKGPKTKVGREVLRQKLAERDGGMFCGYCRKPLTDFSATIDHRLPKSRGGGSTIDNLVLACRKCNHSKGRRTAEEFVMGMFGELGATKSEVNQVSMMHAASIIALVELLITRGIITEKEFMDARAANVSRLDQFAEKKKASDLEQFDKDHPGVIDMFKKLYGSQDSDS